MVRTCRKKHLEYLGPYRFKILQKAMPMVDREYEPVPMFYVETEDRRYNGMLQVNLKEYRKMKVGQYYERGGVVLYTKKEGCYYMSKYDNSKSAIRNLILFARIQLAVLAGIVLIFINFITLSVISLLR